MAWLILDDFTVAECEASLADTIDLYNLKCPEKSDDLRVSPIGGIH